MTISTTTSRISYNGNGVTDRFSFPYRFLANGDPRGAVGQCGRRRDHQDHHHAHTITGAGMTRAAVSRCSWRRPAVRAS